MVSPDRILAMEEAIRDRNLKKVRLLLKAGVPADHVYHPSLGWSFGNLAARSGDVEIFCCLLDAGADINFRGGPGNSMLQEAVCSRSASIDIVNKILNESTCVQADIDVSLKYAPEFGNFEVVERLLQAGANPQYADELGATALVHAVVFDQPAIAIRLLKAGADPMIRIPYEEYYKKTVLEVAASKGMHEFVDACGAQPSSAAPQLPGTLQECLDSIDSWLNAHVPHLCLGDPHPNPSLPKPLSDSSCQDNILLMFRAHDGSNEECIVPTTSDNDLSYQLMTLDAALTERQMMLELFAEEGAMPDVPPEFWKATWLPFASNGAGDYMVWDSVTDQVLHYSHETRLSRPRAHSLFALFQDIANGLNSGKYTYSVHRGIA